MLLTIVIALLLVPAVALLIGQYVHQSLAAIDTAEPSIDPPRELAEAA